MIVTPRFVFLHLHKSGGTFVNECLFKFVPDAMHVGYHLPRSMVPAAYSDVPVLGFVRNPWSYYVSWYTFQLERPNPNFLFRILSDDGRLEFGPTLHNMLDLGAGSVRLELLLRSLPSAYSNQGLNLPNFALEPIRDTQLGFYTYMYRYLYNGGHSPTIVGRMERLREDLPRMLESVAQTVSVEMRRYIEREAPSNTSSHRDYPDYYTPTLRNMVAKRDAEIIERHRYRFGED